MLPEQIRRRELRTIKNAVAGEIAPGRGDSVSLPQPPRAISAQKRSSVVRPAGSSS